jgi:hypothetical protein
MGSCGRSRKHRNKYLEREFIMARLPKLFLLKYEEEWGKDKLRDFILKNKLTTKYDDLFEYVKVDHMMYVRDDKNKPIGVIIVNEGVCGWSLCNYKDNWDVMFGLFKAICRLGSKQTIQDVKKHINNIIDLNDKKCSRLKENKELNKDHYLIKKSYLYITLENMERFINERKKK